MTRDICFLEGKNLCLRPLDEADFTPRYLGWLNDPEVNRFSQRRPYPSTAQSMRAYSEHYARNPKEGFVLAMVVKDQAAHIGNVSLVNIQPVHRCAEIAILIGDRAYWGRGLGAEAVYLLARHAFLALGLNKVFAGSFNPAFVRCVEKLGWRREGEFRERIWSHGAFHSQIWLGQLASEFTLDPRYEPHAFPEGPAT